MPCYQPLVSVRRAIEASQAIDEEERAWLEGRCDQLVGVYRQLRFPLATGIIHGDA